MGITIALINGKGGVGRTTSAINLSHFLSKKGHKCLIVDMDPEGNATFVLNKERSKKKFFKEKYKITEKITLIPSGDCVESFERKASSSGPNGLFFLKELINDIEKDYDFIFLDTASSTNQLLYNSIVASNYCLFICESSITSLEGIVRMYRDFMKLKDNMNINVNVIGVLLTMVKEKTVHDKEVIESIKSSSIGNMLFDEYISQSIVVKEASKKHMFIGDHKENSKVSKQYNSASKELIKKINKHLKGVNLKNEGNTKFTEKWGRNTIGTRRKHNKGISII